MNEDVLTRQPPTYDLRLNYGADENQFGHLRLPKSKAPFPLLMMLHGGYWRKKYDLLHAGHLCAALSKIGIATFNLEYRRVGNPGGGWPGTFEDVSNGLRFIQQHAAEHGINPQRSLVMGHSAGGQLALCLAHRVPTLTGVISLAGVLDLQRGYQLHLSNDAVSEFLGGAPQQVPEHYHEASPSEISIPKVPQKIIHGDADEVVPVEMARDYVRKKKQSGERVELIEPRGAGHFDLIDPQSKFFAFVQHSVEKLLA